MLPFTARSQNPFIIGAYDALIPFLRRCRSCGATVDTEALFGVGISGSGAGAETILINETKKEFLRNRVVKTRKLV